MRRFHMGIILPRLHEGYCPLPAWAHEWNPMMHLSPLGRDKRFSLTLILTQSRCILTRFEPHRYFHPRALADCGSTTLFDQVRSIWSA